MMTLASVVDHTQQQAKAARRLNVGCGNWPLLYWTNLDQFEEMPANLHVRVPPIPYGDGALDDIYAGHFLEHLTQEDADAFLRECWRCLSPGGRLGIVVPDTREILTRYLAGSPDRIEWPSGQFQHMADLDDVCAMFLYSTIQESHHQWSYDAHTLQRLLTRHGFLIVSEIDRWHDPRIPVGAWYQMGFDARKPV